MRWSWSISLLGALAACSSTAPTARAYIVDKLEETIGGPHAIGRVGDFLLENDQVRFVIAGTGVCGQGAPADCTDTYGRVNTTFGGTLVDADLRRVGGDGKGNDQLAELLPGVSFSVIRPTKVEVTHDGSDPNYLNGAAEVAVSGVTDDLFEEVYPINFGLDGPGGSLELTQTYRLEPGKRYVTMVTEIHNPASGAHPFPFLMPQDLDALTGSNIPGLANIQLSVPVGMLPLMGGEQTLFTPGVAGFNVRFAIEDSYKTAGGFPAFPGLAVDFLASRGPGVSYGLATSGDSMADNYVNAYKVKPDGSQGYPGQDITPYSMLLPFTYAGVTAAYMYRPPALLEADERKSFTSYFFVGRGDVGSVYDAIMEQRGTPTGEFGGKVVDELAGTGVPNANVLVVNDKSQVIDQLSTDADGNFLGTLAVGTYSFIVDTDDRTPTQPSTLVITAGGHEGRFVTMPAPGTVAVAVIDEQGRRAPVKIQLIAHDSRVKGIDGRDILYSLAKGERVRPTAFAANDDRYIEGAFWTANGLLETKVRPGSYDVVVSRGPEYELATTTVTVAAGQFATAELALTRAYDTPGWVAGDFHIHAQPSTDSGLPIVQRVTSCAAEGLEVATATDHNYITDYSPVIANAQLDQWLLGVSGMELTTFEMGHFIGWPLRIDPGSTRGGEFLWAHQKPGDLFSQLRALAIDPKNSVVQVAHPRQQVLGYWAQFFVDQDTAEPYTPTGILGVFAPYGDEFKMENYSQDFDAIEILTGRRIEDVHAYKAPNPLPPGPFPDPQPVAGQVIVGKDGRPQYPGTAETWFTLLDRGKRPTAMGASDSHHLLGDEPGYARTLMFVGDGNDQPGGYTRAEVVDAVRHQHAIATNAPFVTIAIGSARVGDTVKQSGAVDVDIHVAAPSWAAVDTLTVYSSASTTPDHVVMTMAIPAPGTSFDTKVTIHPTQDAWVVAEVTGSGNMFPVLSPTEFPPLDATIIIGALSVGLDLSNLPLTAKLKPIRVHFSTPYAITNPIWIDTDGNGWTAPKTPLPRTAPKHSSPRDVRATFDALPEVQ